MAPYLSVAISKENVQLHILCHHTLNTFMFAECFYAFICTFLRHPFD